MLYLLLDDIYENHSFPSNWHPATIFRVSTRDDRDYPALNKIVEWVWRCLFQIININMLHYSIYNVTTSITVSLFPTIYLLRRDRRKWWCGFPFVGISQNIWFCQLCKLFYKMMGYSFHPMVVGGIPIFLSNQKTRWSIKICLKFTVWFYQLNSQKISNCTFLFLISICGMLNLHVGDMPVLAIAFKLSMVKWI